MHVLFTRLTHSFYIIYDRPLLFLVHWLSVYQVWDFLYHVCILAYVYTTVFYSYLKPLFGIQGAYLTTVFTVTPAAQVHCGRLVLPDYHPINKLLQIIQKVSNILNANQGAS